MGELYGNVFQYAYELEFVSLRYFNVFGPRQDPGSPYSGVLSLFIAAMRNGGSPLVYGDGEQSRDFTYVENVVQANLQAFEAPGVAGMAFNLGTGGRYTLNETLRLLAKFAGRRKVSPAVRSNQRSQTARRGPDGALPQLTLGRRVA